jgi:hypothetical protein
MARNKTWTAGGKRFGEFDGEPMTLAPLPPARMPVHAQATTA